MELEDAKKLILDEADATVENAVVTFKEVRKFLTQDFESLAALFEEAKTDLNTESLKDMNRILYESMKLLYDLDMSVCEMFTLNQVIDTDRVVRLFSAFEVLLEYDVKVQESLMEGDYEEVG